MKGYTERVVEEKIGLENKISKLISYIFTSNFQNLPFHEQELLRTQLQKMREYDHVLVERIKLIYPDSFVAVLNHGYSVICVDDGCYVIKNLVDGEWRISSWIYPEALEALKMLPSDPSKAKNIGAYNGL